MSLVRLTRTIKDFGILVEEDQVFSFIDSASPYFKSLYYYPADAMEYFNTNKGSIKGYKGKVFTNQITFDIDSKDLEVSRDNTIRLIQYLEQQGLYNDYAGNISFSGNKGFHVHISTDYTFYPNQLKELCMYLSKQIKFNTEAGFKIDPTIYNTNRIFRVPNTPHEKSGLFKVEMLSHDLINFTMDQILEAAKTTQETYPFQSSITREAVEQVLANIPKKKEISHIAPSARSEIVIDKPCIAALQSGDMKDGESNAGLLRLANHYRKSGYSKEECKALLLEAADNRAAKHPGTNLITVEKINQEILYSIYSGDGYTFTCTDWMLNDKCGGVCQLKCKPQGTEIKKKSFRDSIVTKLEAAPIIEVSQIEGIKPEIAPKQAIFRDVVSNIKPEEGYKMTGFKHLRDTASSYQEFVKTAVKFRVLTGIKAIDDKVKIIPNGLTIINARPGVGKTSIALNILENVSKSGQTAACYSVDMDESEFYTKSASKALKISPDEAMDLFYNEDPELESLRQEAHESTDKAVENVLFNYDKSLTVAKIEKDLQALIAIGNKPYVLVVDYVQKINGASDYHNATNILLELKRLISQYKVCIIVLSQIPGGIGGDEETPVHTARAARGGSIYEENASICINLWRPLKFAGTEQDIVMGYSVSKNRMGECFSGLLHFNGSISEIRDLTEEERLDAEVSLAAYAELKVNKEKKRGQFR